MVLCMIDLTMLLANKSVVHRRYYTKSWKKLLDMVGNNKNVVAYYIAETKNGELIREAGTKGNLDVQE